MSEISCSRQTSFTDRSPRRPANTISIFCRAVQLRYLRCSLNPVSFSVKRPMLSRTPDGLSGATPLRDRPAPQLNYLSTRDRGAGQRGSARAGRRTLSEMSSYPDVRLRRFRRSGPLRALVRETRLSLDQFVMPLFVAPESLRNEELPGMSRWSVEDVVREVEELVRLGVQAVILFGIPEEKDEQATGAWEDDGIVQRALRALRPRFPELLLLTDVCLCEYTSHGHCGVIVDGEVHNDQSVELLARTAVSHVDAGADVVAPSDMMDGRVAGVREALDDRGFESTPILAYSAKIGRAHV